MKRLRNIAIYYIIFGVLCFVSFFASKLWPIALVGIFLFLIFLILRFIFNIKTLPIKLTKKQSGYIKTSLYLLPFIFSFWAFWYIGRPYRQTIIIPKNYEGVVAIKYGQKDGQKQWTSGFLGFGASRLIKVDSTGIAKTQFVYHNNDITFLGISKPNYSGGIKIYFENDLKFKIPIQTYPMSDTDEMYFERKVKQNEPVGYFEDEVDSPPLIIFVITKPSNYYKYFMKLGERKELLEKRQKEDPDLYYEVYEGENVLKKEYKHYYK